MLLFAAGSKSLTAGGREKFDDRIVKVDGMEKDESSKSFVCRCSDGRDEEQVEQQELKR